MLRSKLLAAPVSGFVPSFNPCSRGCCARSVRAIPPGQIDLLFQSLFSWMLRSKNDILGLVIDRPAVSILVLVDVALEDGSHDQPKRRHGVSILVLVDVALEEPGSKGDASMMHSFNPCSRGCCARSLHHGKRSGRLHCFNPCSRGCCARRFPNQREWYIATRFQSLFSWMLRSKTLLS